MKQSKLLLAIALAALGGAFAARAASTPIAGRVILRPLTPSDKTFYGLPSSTEVSGGLSSIGVGTPAHFEAQASGVTASNTVVVWTLTGKPLASAAVLSASPLGANVPTYAPSDSAVLHYAMVGSRVMLRPDLEGQYQVTASITNGTLKTNVTFTITAASYMGWYNACIACHSGSAWVIAPNMASWTNTLHASKFSRSIDGLVGSYSASCLSCHTVGYDNNTNVNDGGFYQEMTAYNWKFPTVLTNGNWASMQTNYPAVANVANIQCENCHGPGSEHIVFNGKIGNTNTIAINWDSGNCGQCHDATTHHIKATEWKNSGHAVSPNQTGATCVRCHTGPGFKNFVEGAPAVATQYTPITCAACHDPHDVNSSKPHQLRTVAPVIVGDGVVITNAGTSQICLDCHHSRNGDSGATNIMNYVLGLPTWAGGSSFGTHHGPQGDMFYGSGGYTYGQNIPSSAHRDAIVNPCVTCHMQTTPAATDPAFLLGGGHTFNIVYKNGTTNIQMTGACVQCHGAITNVSLVREDFNGDGVIEDVQTEVQHLLDKLSTMLPPNNSVKTSLSVATNWTMPQLRAAYNWQFVSEDRSKGVHNVAYAVGLLKASINDLNPDSNNDGLPDAWQVQYFGSATNANAAPTACPAGDGIPNWVKYSMGLNPLVAGVALPDGVVWANAGASSGTGLTRIYTAAEVTFETAVGKNYQIQGISQLGGGTWQNIGTPIAGTGNTMSYLTPTRNNAQQYYRIVVAP